jgi:hypothetical protein
MIPDQNGAIPMMQEHMFIEWGELPYVDFSKPYWDKNAIRDLSFGGKTYLMAGDFNYSSYSMTAVLLFNKNKFRDMGIEYPYEQVLDGKWTLDAMNAVIKDAGTDIDGDGEMNFAVDGYGIGGWMYEIPNNLFYAMGGRVIEKDTANMPVISALTEQSINVMSAVYGILIENKSNLYNNKEWAIDMTAFIEGRLLMIDTRFISLTGYRSMEDDFGIIPAPKYNETQIEYMPLVSNSGSFTCIPVTNSDLEFTSVMLEALSCESYNMVTPAFFNKTLQTKISRDGESEQMLDLIMRQHSFAFAPPSLNGLATSYIETKKNDYVSYVNKLESKADKELEKIIEQINSIGE